MKWNLPGAEKASLSELPQVKDRMTFLYLEKCVLSIEDSALKGMFKEGYVLIPPHSFLTLMLGPGTKITHRAAELAGNAGVTIVWCGEGVTKFYGFGRPLTQSSTLLLRQAKIVSVPRLHIEAVRKMYSLRYPNEDLSGLTLQQMRGKEGARVRSEYRQQSEKWRVPWNGRNYDPEDFSRSDSVNKALSCANACLYSLALAVVSALGLSPGLGFIHEGHEKSFIYDIADLYKSETSIPVSFQIASEGTESISGRVRAAMRQKFFELKIAERMVRDIKFILNIPEGPDECTDDSPLFLWDNGRDAKDAGILYYEYPADRESE